MAIFVLSTFIFALQTSFYHTEAMPTVGATSNLTMPENCKGKTFCTEDIGYPQEEINEMLKNQPELKFRIGVNPNDPIPPAIVDREGTDDKIINLCEEENDYGYIRYIIDEENNLRIVVQSEDRFTQHLPITRCKSPKPTAVHKIVNELEQNLKCKENTLNINLVVLRLDLKGFEMARVKGGVPIGCQCIYVEK